MSEDLAQKKCVACEGTETPFSEEQSREWLHRLHKDWELSGDTKKLVRRFEFQNFKQAIAFINEVAKIAEEEGHHPDFHVHYNKVTVEIWTHALGGLWRNDFILAAKIDKVV